MNQPQYILTRKQMQAADQRTIANKTYSSLELMERAGQAILPVCNQYKIDAGRVVIIVGKGNNGGDGFVAARLLRLKHVPVTVVPLFPIETLQGDAAIQAQKAQDIGVKIRPATSAADLPALQAWLHRAVIIVDAIFGIGLNKPIQGWVAQVIDCINNMDRPVLAVDIASGIHADTGEVLGIAIKATATLPIAAYKWGHWLQQGKMHGGDMLSPTPIGISIETIQHAQHQHVSEAITSTLMTQDMIQQTLPKRPPDAYKQTFGHVWVFGGSIGYTGAPKLAAMGAQAVGAGLTSIACPDDVYPIIATSSLETMVHPQDQAPWQNAHAMVAGPGWGTQHHAQLLKLLEHPVPIVLDADALHMLANHDSLQHALKKRNTLSIITPHPGEAAVLLGQTSKVVQNNRLNAAINLATKYHTWVVLKGAQTLIASPEKHVWLCPFGSSNLATAGTGDVLAGMLGGMLANQMEHAPCHEMRILSAITLHGLAGENDGWYQAGQLAPLIAQYIKTLQGNAMP